jgi:hypothetical protein
MGLSDYRSDEGLREAIVINRKGTRKFLESFTSAIGEHVKGMGMTYG